MNQKEFDHKLDAVIKQALLLQIERDIAALPPDDEARKMNLIRPEFDAKMRRICARSDRRDRMKPVLQTARRVAIAAMVAIAILFGTLMTNTAVRATIVEVIVEWYEQFTRFVGISSEEEAKHIEARSWSPAYLPEGYMEVSRFESDSTIVEYEDHDGNLLLLRYTVEINDLTVDNEETIYSTIEVDEITYYLSEAASEAKPNVLVWFEAGYRLNLSGHLDVDTLLSVAVSTK